MILGNNTKSIARFMVFNVDLAIPNFLGNSLLIPPLVEATVVLVNLDYIIDWESLDLPVKMGGTSWDLASICS